MRETWQLWECLPSKTLIELAQYQYDKYGTRLDIISDPQEYTSEVSIESLEEIDKIMRIPSKYPKGFYSHG